MEMGSDYVKNKTFSNSKVPKSGHLPPLSDKTPTDTDQIFMLGSFLSNLSILSSRGHKKKKKNPPTDKKRELSIHKSIHPLQLTLSKRRKPTMSAPRRWCRSP